MKIISLNAWDGQQQKELKKYLEEKREETDIFLFQEAGEKMEVLRRELFLDQQSVTTRKREFGYEGEWYATSILKNNIHFIASGIFFAGAGKEKQGHGHWLEVEKDRERYILCNIHGMARPGGKADTEDRVAQSKEIIDFLSQRPGQHIIMGDFNLHPDTRSVALFEEAGYRNLIKEYTIDTTRNELAWARYPDNKHLFADYAFVNAAVKVADFQVPKNEISDHLPLELTIA